MDILIVDDSRLARRELLEMLRGHPEHQVVGEAASCAEAVSLIDKLEPELLLLDIHLPDGSGFDVLEQASYTPKVIFTTAYEQHALRAFEVNALDYLLKPVTAQRLAQALERAGAADSAHAKSAQQTASRSTSDHLFIRDGERCHFVRFEDIRLIEVDGNYVRLHFGTTKAMLYRSLNQLESRLDPRMFFRANRQQVVNLGWIDGIDPAVGDGLIIRMRGGGEVEVSRRQARELRQQLEL